MRSKLSDVQIPNCTLHELVLGDIQNRAEHIALVDAITGQSYSYRQLKDLCTRTASGLARLGVKQGDIVAIVSPNSTAFVIVFYAILQLGAVVTTINPGFTKHEMGNQLKDSGAQYVYTINATVNTVQQAANFAGTIQKIICDREVDDCVPLSRLLSDDGSALPKNIKHDVQNDTAAILYSSGTTGLPKGVMIKQRNLVANVVQLEHPDLAIPELIVDGQRSPHVELCICPFYHAYAVMLNLTLDLHRGYKLVILPSFSPHSFLQAIQDYKVSYIPLVPPMVLFMMNSPLVANYDLTSIKYLLCSAAPLDQKTNLLFKQKFPYMKLMQCYGMSEGTFLLSQRASTKREGSVGEAVPNTEVKVVDIHTGEELGAGKRGELWLRGPTLMKGYLNRPEATRHTIDAEGWLHTGDVAYYDETGNFYIVDRIKELIKVKGYQVAPAELEAVLLTHPAVADAGVIGVPHERSGEVPRGYVVRKSKNANISTEELATFVQEKVAKYKWLTGGIEFIDVIPKSGSGKILRRELRKLCETVKSHL